jgi:hypothetical protein
MARKKITVTRKQHTRPAHHRKGYHRADGTWVKGTEVKRTVVQKSIFQIKDRGAPGKGPKLITMKPGGLGGPGYMSSAERTRHARLNASVQKDGYERTMHRLTALTVYGKRTMTDRQKRQLQKDRDWLSQQYGGPGSYGPRK